MKSLYSAALVFFLIHSCIPLSKAPTISDYETVKGKRFKRGLPQKNMFIFEDPKEAGEFYDYINMKFGLQDYYVDVQVPFKAGGKERFFSFYEIQKKSKTVNLLPVFFDVAVNAALGNDEYETYAATDEVTITRSGTYYIAIEVFSDEENDCLSKEYVNRDTVLMYLRDLKEQYLMSHNLHEVVFKNK